MYRFIGIVGGIYICRGSYLNLDVYMYVYIYTHSKRMHTHSVAYKHMYTLTSINMCAHYPPGDFKNPAEG